MQDDNRVTAKARRKTHQYGKACCRQYGYERKSSLNMEH
jgi:hypothetical protein